MPESVQKKSADNPATPNAINQNKPAVQRKDAYQSPAGQKPVYQSPQGQKPAIQAKQTPVQTKSNGVVQRVKEHKKEATGQGMARKDPGHGNVKSKQHAAARAKKDVKREDKRAEFRQQQAEKRAATAEKGKKKGK